MNQAKSLLILVGTLCLVTSVHAQGDPSENAPAAFEDPRIDIAIPPGAPIHVPWPDETPGSFEPLPPDWPGQPPNGGGGGEDPIYRDPFVDPDPGGGDDDGDDDEGPEPCLGITCPGELPWWWVPPGGGAECGGGVGGPGDFPPGFFHCDGVFGSCPGANPLPPGGAGAPEWPPPPWNPPIGNPSGSGNPEPPMWTSSPVNLAFGHKFMSEVDAQVMLRGRPFTIHRTYTSNTDFGATGLVGEHWTLNIFYFLDGADVSTTPQTLGISIPGVGKVHFEKEVGQNIWNPIGPSPQRIEEKTLTIGSTTYNVYRLFDPGMGEVDFYRHDTPADVDPALRGLVLQVRDTYGNARTFEYTIYDFSNVDIARLTKIYLGGDSDSNAGARVVLTWHDDHDNDPDALIGRLEKLEVQHEESPSTWVARQKVEYTYVEEANTKFHDAVGTDGDLAQVARWMWIDNDNGLAPTGESDWHITVCQYRYHDGSDENGTDADSPVDGLSDEYGEPHQIKFIIRPQQLEYAAQQFNRNETSAQSVLEYSDGLLDEGDGDVAFTDAKTSEDIRMVDLAAKIIEEYDASKRVKTQYLQTECGCAGSALGVTLEYEYLTHSSGDYARSLHVTEKTGTGASPTHYRNEYYDLVEFTDAQSREYYYLGNHVVADDTDTRIWGTHYEYDQTDWLVTEIHTPSALDTYTVGSPTVAPVYDSEETVGLILTYTYDNDNRVVTMSTKKGENGSAEKVVEYEYGDSANSGERDHLLKKVERFRVAGSSAADNVETIEYTYGFHTTDEDDVAWVETEVEAETNAENGPGGSYYWHEFYDDDGTNYWSRYANDMIVRRDHDDDTGQITEIEFNADPAALGSDFPDSSGRPSTTGISWAGRHTDGGALTTTYALDLMGRVQSATGPSGLVTRVVREVRELDGGAADRPGILYAALVILPPVSDDDEFPAPAAVYYMDAASQSIATSTFSLATDTNSPYGDIFGSVYDYKLDEEQSRSRVVHTYTGLIQDLKEWHSLAGDGEGSGVYNTDFTYDDLGRIDEVTAPNGTIYAYTYDELDRVVSTSMGTTSGNVKTVAEYFYDGGSTAAHGEGNGVVTFVRMHVDDTTTRDTVMTYDHRDNLTKIKNPLAPHVFFEYDNLGRVTAAAIVEDYDTAKSDLDLADSERGLYVGIGYSQRGLTYVQRVAIDPTLVSSSRTYLELHNWYDDAGQIIAAWGPNGPAIKLTHDALGRQVAAYFTDRGDDSDPGQSPPATDIHSDVYTSTRTADVTGDIVLEQVETTYIEDGDYSGDHTGYPELMTRYERPHDLASTGALTATDAITLSTGIRI